MSKRSAATDTSVNTDVLTPASTPSETPNHSTGASISSLRTGSMDTKLEEKPKQETDDAEKVQEELQPSVEGKEKESQQQDVEDAVKKPKNSKKVCRKPSHKERKTAKKASKNKAAKDASESDSSEDEADSESDSESDSSEDEKPAKRKSKRSKQNKKVTKDKKRRKSVSETEESDSDESEDEKPKKTVKTKHSKKASKDKKKRKAKAVETSDGSEADSSERDSSEEQTAKRKKKAAKKSKKVAEPAASDGDSDSDAASDDVTALQAQIAALKLQMVEKKKGSNSKRRRASDSKPAKRSKSKFSKGPSAYQRVDQLWDSKIHNYTLKPSAEQDDDEYAEHAFLVRRCFNWENKYTDTVVDIKSKQLRAVLAEVMKDCKSVSLEAEEPSIDPNTLFLYLEDLRTYYKKTLNAKIRKEKKRKAIKKLETQRSLCKALVGYIDEDYAETKKTLYPLLEAGNITFDLMWALFKPDEVTVTSCYGSWEHPRCFKVEYANKCCSMQRGDWYAIEGKYLEYDGKSFGFGDFEIDIDGFKGPRKISSLAAYPLKYHKDPESVKAKVLERAERFVDMQGMQYKFHKGLAFLKKKKTVAKIHINGRIMVDPATFRRINPNYPISWVKPKEDDDLFSLSDDDDDCSCCGQDSDDEKAHGEQKDLKAYDLTEDPPKYKYKWSKNEEGCNVFISVEVDEKGDPIRNQKVESLVDIANVHSKSFSEEELLLTSPVVLGFSFADKLWLEFSLSGVTEIEYNEDAFESLVLPDNQKEIVRALVESHKFNAAKTIDDVVQGKGKGLVSVLHGPPGTGKTLTAEGISELLKCPLYMVSAGELGTDPGKLEYELQKILDIAHSWGAVLLLDEADVFLEKREVHDIHRNALVSIFLRLLEYFQGILFLTTNRVDTFDEAFQSRIHLPLRYGELTGKAKKTVWKMFFEVVRKTDPGSIVEFSDHELELLSRHQLNGRQIKNAVRTAQALALREGKTMRMEHVRKVLDVSETFDRDLKGGTGYMDAMRSYT